MRTRFPTALAIITLIAIGGCRKPAESQSTSTSPAGQQASSTPIAPDGTVAVPIGKETFYLEIADSVDEHRRGLMYRESMPQDRGMIFVFSRERMLQFWMEATFIPLDILYLDATGRVVSIKPMKPRDRTGVPSDGLAKYAIELNQGAAARAVINPGDVIALPESVLSLKGAE